MSPETITGSGYDWKSDVWSLGCVVYELATLESPFRPSDMGNTNIYAIFKKIQACDYRPIDDTRSTRLRNTVHSMIQLNPDLRPTAAEVRDIAVRALEEGIGVKSSSSSSSSRSRPGSGATVPQSDGPEDIEPGGRQESAAAAAAAAAAAVNADADARARRRGDGGDNDNDDDIDADAVDAAIGSAKIGGDAIVGGGRQNQQRGHGDDPGRGPSPPTATGANTGDNTAAAAEPAAAMSPERKKRSKSRTGSAGSSSSSSSKAKAEAKAAQDPPPVNDRPSGGGEREPSQDGAPRRSSRAGSANKSRSGSAKSRSGSARSGSARSGSARSRKEGNATPASVPGVPAVVVMETVLEKLRLLDYENRLPGRGSIGPISPVYFALGRGDDAGTALTAAGAITAAGAAGAAAAPPLIDLPLFADYCAVCAWALSLCGVAADAFSFNAASIKAGDEDPREVATMLVRAFRDAGVSCNYSPAALVRPGVAQCVALNSLLNAALRRAGFAFAKPDFSKVGTASWTVGGDGGGGGGGGSEDDDEDDEEEDMRPVGDAERLCPEHLFADTIGDAIRLGVAPPGTELDNNDGSRGGEDDTGNDNDNLYNVNDNDNDINENIVGNNHNGGSDARRVLTTTRVSPAAWAEELARVAPALRVVRVRADDRCEWRDRAEALAAAAAALEADHASAHRELEALAAVLSREHAALASRDARLAAGLAASSGPAELAAAQRRCDDLDARAVALRDECSAASEQLAAVEADIGELRDEWDTAAPEAAGAGPLAALRGAQILF
jgi:hypothetical protein